MAEEKITILKVDTSQAVSSVGDLRENIKVLKERLQDLEIGTEDYQSTVRELKVNQDALKDAMYGTAASFEDVTNAATGANIAFKENGELVTMQGVSYNALVHKLADLKQAWRSTTDEMERAKIGAQINSVNNQLKGMDASVGNYQRNVGNYIGAVDHLTGAFGSMGKGAQSVINPIKGATMGLKTLSATPVVGILGLLATILMKVIDAMKTSEETTNAMTAALAPLNAIGDACTKVLQALGDVVAGLVGGFTKLMGAIFGVNDATRQRIALAEQEKQLAAQQRETTIANAEAERDAAIAREKAYDKEKYTAEERLAFAKEAGQREAEIAERAYQDAKLAYEIQRAKNALTASSAEEKQKEADAYAALVKAETAYHQRVTGNLKEQNRLRREIQKEQTDAARAAMDAYKTQMKAETDLLKQEAALYAKGSDERLAKDKEIRRKELDLATFEAKTKIKDRQALNRTLLVLQQQYAADMLALERQHQLAVEARQNQHLKNIANQYTAGTLDYLRAVRDLRQKELADIRQEAGESEEAFTARRLAAQQAYADSVRAINDRHRKDELTALQVSLAQTSKLESQQLENAVALAAAEADAVERYGRQKGETEDEYNLRRLKAQKALDEALNAQEDYQREQAQVREENRLNVLKEGSIAYLAQAVELKRYELDTLHRTEEESEDEFRARQLAAEKEYYNARKALQKGWADAVSQSVSGVSALLGSIADMYEADGEVSRKEAQRIKNLRVASATIDMLQGATTAYSTAQVLGPPMGPIVGAINAAAVVASGLANIQKIKATDASGTSSASTAAPVIPATVSAPTVTPEVQTVANLTGAAEEDRLNRMAKDHRVYILSSDLEADRDAVRARVAETTF